MAESKSKSDAPQVDAPDASRREVPKGAVDLGVPPEPKGGEANVAGGRTDGPILVDEGALPAEADKSSYPTPNDAKSEDPPVRTTRPDVPVVAASAVGAGQHVPPDPELFTPDGKPRLDKDQG